MSQHFTITEAIQLAADAHRHQRELAGKPGIVHPLAVMLDMDTEEEMIVAVLHDVVEDTEITLDHLRSLGASETVVAAVDAITKRKGEVYEEYLPRVKANPIALKVKLADLRNNLSPARIAQHTPERREKLEKKWKNAQSVLTSPA